MTRHWYGRQDAAASVNSTPAGLAPSPAGRTDDECRTLPLLGTSVSRTPPAPGELPSRASALNIALTATWLHCAAGKEGNVNVNVEFKVTLHEHVRYRDTLQYLKKLQSVTQLRTLWWRIRWLKQCSLEIAASVIDIGVSLGTDLQNILRQSYDYLTIMPKLRSTYDGRLIYKTSYFHR